MDSVRSSPQVLRDPLPGTQTLVRIVAGTQDQSTQPADFGFVDARLPTSTLGNIDAGHCISQDAAAPSAVFASACWWGAASPSVSQQSLLDRATPPIDRAPHQLRADCRAADRTSEQQQRLVDIAADLAGWNGGLVDEKAKQIVEFEKAEPPMK